MHYVYDLLHILWAARVFIEFVKVYKLNIHVYLFSLEYNKFEFIYVNATMT